MINSEGGLSSDDARAAGGEYQVFLSFRGPDTRHGFTDFLYHDLVDAGVRVFRDEDDLRVGEMIGGNLLRAINNSLIYIPIFSRTYASSKWCLRELAHIVDNVSKSVGKKSILPIFLDVEPEDVKLKTRRYRKAFLKHEKEFPNEVEAWKRALAEIDEIKGWNMKKDQGQAAMVKLVVEKVLEKLEVKQKSVPGHLVSLDDQIKELKMLLDVDQPDVRLIGIYGMGGIGKTTVAKIIFNQLSSQFGKCCSFLEDIRESSLTKEGMVQLQKKLLSDIVGSRSAEKFEDIEQGMRRIGETLHTKVLVVLDDVDNKEHIKKLIGNNSLHSGSRIIITTRNTAILQVEGFKGEILQYEILKMDYGPALQLFCRHAFGRDSTSDDYHGLSNEIVTSTGGLPLAIEVIGSLLNGKNKAFWEETSIRLRSVPEKEILKKLRISYDDLDEYQQQIFLDIACFFFNENKTNAIYMWADCQFYPERAIDVLTCRCLIKILDNDKFWMHGQLIDLGRHIVRQESLSDLGKRSRLWIAKEAYDIIRSEERKDKVQALEIDGLEDYIEITNEQFERLQSLRFLKLGFGTFVGDFASCHSKLRWISWYSPHDDFRADNMYFDHLLVFKLEDNSVTDDSKAWDLIKRARNLKVLSLTWCLGITTIPDFSKCLGLESLTLAHCYNLKRIESFIRDLQSLIVLEIEGCMDLIDLPKEVGSLVKLKRFSLEGCFGLRELPVSLGNLTSLIELNLSHTTIARIPNSIQRLVKLESFLLTHTRIRELPNFIGELKSLRILHLSRKGSYSMMNHVWQLPSGIIMLKNLEELDLSGRSEMKGEIPIGIGELSSLRLLDLKHTYICGIPRTINKLCHLQTLDLRGCHKIQILPELPTSLTCLLLESQSLLSVPNMLNLTNLVELLISDGSDDIGKSNLIIKCDLRWIGRISRLKKLHLHLFNVLAPPELASLSNLEELTLSRLDLEKLVHLPPSLLRLNLPFFSIKWAELLHSYLRLRNLSNLEFHRGEVEDIPLDGLPRLESLTIDGCKLLQRLSIPLELRMLRQTYVSDCPKLLEIQVEGLSKSLESFCTTGCKSLRRIGGLSYLKNLEELVIQRCNALTTIEGLHELESLKSLYVRGCTSLRKLIDASCTSIPDDCLVQIQGCGDLIKDSSQSYPFGISWKRYREEILLNTSNKKG
ncbi:disease resistance protein RPV1-like isoform X1 [Eucalyptus grandis]|uniref:disease resistance protein RPV1-like isoform X1 n=2 Tax=Eucalyptus grandis TaxID=71139 RepID=UPI00192E8B21|nr:disease resistance protein RPV1-like isoform X1 [Eucalyptus grandis]XP_039155081.1 disease resistance protein RPV1-like isoform X1 [Eucalyptus grandis]XP_039155082.1 disease resistance protein RPV1-like isoform X1 [Eucalyptus grandis]